MGHRRPAVDDLQEMLTPSSNETGSVSRRTEWRGAEDRSSSSSEEAAWRQRGAAAPQFWGAAAPSTASSQFHKVANRRRCSSGSAYALSSAQPGSTKGPGKGGGQCGPWLRGAVS